MVRLTEASTDSRFTVYESADDFVGLESAWNRLAVRTHNPFVTHQWVLAWWRAFGGEGGMAAVLRGEDGGIVAGAGVRRESPRLLRAAANEYSGDWDVVALDESSRRMIWRQIAALPGAQLTFQGLPAGSPSVDIARDALGAAGFRVAVSRYQLSPYVVLPGSWEQLLERLSKNQRSKLRRYRRNLEGEGELVFRTTDSPDLDADLDRFLQLEAAGWKGATGTAILNDPGALRLYTDFAHAAAAQGWLRLHLLELDGMVIAGGFGCVLGDAAFLLKSCFDERYRRAAPGTVLRAEALRAAIGEGLSFYEFGGAPDPHKLRWGGDMRECLLVRAYRGSGLPAFVYRHKLRPAAGRLRDITKSATPDSVADLIPRRQP